jgi:hypothetical protein
MDEAARIAFINSQIASAQIRAMGMQAENLSRVHSGDEMKYFEKDFEALSNEFCISHNAVIGYLTGR